MTRRIIIAAFLLCSVLCMYGAYRVNNSNGELRVTNVIIKGENSITGVLYEPLMVEADAPCILLAHGITNSKEPLSGIALELAKHGYIAISIDLVGHGRSSGELNGIDPSLGVVQAAKYLLDYSNNSYIGLVGHSLGAGAVYYTASIGVPVNGIVLIGGGIGINYYTQLEEIMFPQPWNPLVIIGRYDVLFNREEIQNLLELTFPINTPSLNQLKGEPDSGTMTLWLMPHVSHLFEPVDPIVVASTVDWFNKINHIETNALNSYLRRETLILFALFFFLSSLILLPSIEKGTTIAQGFEWRYGAIYGLFGFITFIPSMLIGNLLPFPPQIFGASIALWLLIWGLLIYVYSFHRRKIDLLRVPRKEIWYAFGAFSLTYIYCYGLEALFGFNFRLLVPIMRPLTIKRSIAFLTYLPFMLLHFYLETSWFREKTSNLMAFVVSKLGLFSGLLLIQYGGFFLLDTIFVSGFTGFILEFLMAIVPLLLISTFITYMGTKYGRKGYTVILNTLILSWIAAGLFPY